MARYDRIAPLTTPDRDDAFPGWLILRDLEGRERDVDFGRRARLRYLALRPVRRLLDHAPADVPIGSFERQVETVREELGHLPTRDPERTRLAQYLHDIRRRTPEALASATLDMGVVTTDSGHDGAAEEFFRTSLEVAECFGLAAAQASAHRRLGELWAEHGAWGPAESQFASAATLALPAGDRIGWAQATAGLVTVRTQLGRADEARPLLREILERGRVWADPAVAAIGAAGLAAEALRSSRYEEALELGWSALPRLDSESRARALRVLGSAFARLGMLAAADRCHEHLMREASPGAPLLRARIAHAVAAADTGEADTFRQRRKAMIRGAGQTRSEPALHAALHLGLGRGCIQVGDADFARDHLREAIATARRHGLRNVPEQASDLLSALEAAASELLATPRGEPGEVARRIAAAVAASEPIVAKG